MYTQLIFHTLQRRDDLFYKLIPIVCSVWINSSSSMDLQVYAVIAIVFLVSLCSLLFINKQFRGGKTFEDVLEEKRQFAEKLYGPRKKTTKKPATGKKVNLFFWLFQQKKSALIGLLYLCFYQLES